MPFRTASILFSALTSSTSGSSFLTQSGGSTEFGKLLQSSGKKEEKEKEKEKKAADGEGGEVVDDKAGEDNDEEGNDAERDNLTKETPGVFGSLRDLPTGVEGM